MFSQIRGGASTVVGPSSRRSRCTVSGLSGQLEQNPATRLAKRVYVASPAQAMGRYASDVSSGFTPSSRQKISATPMALAWVIMAPLGLPVVPEV
jgi:hypothetical protein